jgi:hypothetical protein
VRVELTNLCLRCPCYEVDDWGERKQVRIRQWFEYTFNDGTLLAWDIDKARQLLAEHPTRERNYGRVPEDILIAILSDHELDGNHADHVDISYPGIAANVAHNGETLKLLLDGHHRAAKCLERGLPFGVVQLTSDEEKACRLDAVQIMARHMVSQMVAMHILEHLDSETLFQLQERA